MIWNDQFMSEEAKDLWIHFYAEFNNWNWNRIWSVLLTKKRARICKLSGYFKFPHQPYKKWSLRNSCSFRSKIYRRGKNIAHWILFHKIHRFNVGSGYIQSWWPFWFIASLMYKIGKIITEHIFIHAELVNCRSSKVFVS